MNGIALNKTDIPAVNGIVHIVDRVNYVQKSTHELLQQFSYTIDHLDYILSLNNEVFDEENAVQVGVNEDGLPVFDTTGAMIFQNNLYDFTIDLKNEDSLSTVLLLTDEVFSSQREMIRPYYNTDSAELTERLISLIVSRDLIFKGKLTMQDINDTLVSLFNVKVPFNQGNVEFSQETSNGMVYLLNQCNIELEHKILPIIIEGEDTTKITNALSRTGLHRPIEGASGGLDFLFTDHGANPGIVKYYPGSFSSTKYNCYWKAINNFSSSKISQKLGGVTLLSDDGDEKEFGIPVDISAMDTLVYSKYTGSIGDTAVAIEEYLGTIQFEKHTSDYWVQLEGSGRNPVCVDYIKLVPVLDK
jgi:hypothetical protein